MDHILRPDATIMVECTKLLEKQKKRRLKGRLDSKVCRSIMDIL